MEEAEALSDRIAIMKGGRLIVCDTADEIKRSTGADRFEDAFVRVIKGVTK
jgi:ABC-type multidrug transport system ATPase subunit